MARRLIIAGAGGHGREVFAWATSSPRFLREHDVDTVAFINDGAPSVQPPAPVIGTIDGFEPLPDDVVICAIGAPHDRRAVVTKLNDRGAGFVTFVHDDALIGPRVVVGVGAVVCPRVVISVDVRVGAHVHLNAGALVHHDAVIGDFATVSPGAILLGGSDVGEDAYIGAGAVVLPGRAVGSGASVGALAAVTRAVPPAVVVAGVPARPLDPA